MADDIRNDQPEYTERVKNLGLISAMIRSTLEPKNKEILWYDRTITEGCPIKYYDLTTQTWELLVKP